MKGELAAFVEPDADGPLLDAYVAGVSLHKRKTINFLVELNAKLQQEIRYVVRMESGVQTPDETLSLKSGSCRDSAWLLVQILRRSVWRRALCLVTSSSSGRMSILLKDRRDGQGFHRSARVDRSLYPRRRMDWP